MTAATSSTGEATPRPTIELDDVVAVRGHMAVLDVDSLRLKQGVSALVGPNGAGKSTLLHLVSGLLAPHRGSVHVLGFRPADARRQVAYVLQAQQLPKGLLVSAREVIALGRAATRGAFRPFGRADRAAVDSAIERLEIGSFSNRHLTELSGGQRQRVFVAQGLVQEAEVLLLDEPIAGLDLASATRIRHVIEEERSAGRTVLVATHDLEEAGRADHVVLLARRVVASGAPADVLRAEHLRAAYGGRVLEIGERIVVEDDAHGHLGPP